MSNIAFLGLMLWAGGADIRFERARGGMLLEQTKWPEYANRRKGADGRHLWRSESVANTAGRGYGHGHRFPEYDEVSSEPGLSNDDHLLFISEGAWHWADGRICGLGAGRGAALPILPLGLGGEGAAEGLVAELCLRSGVGFRGGRNGIDQARTD